MDFTVESLIALIKQGATVPDSQNLFTQTEYLQMLNFEMLSDIVPTIVLLREEFLSAYIDYSPVSSNLYKIPANAVGSTIKEVYAVQGDNFRLLPRSNKFGVVSNQSAKGFCIDANYIRLAKSAVSAVETLRVNYSKMPNTLVSSNDCATITAVDNMLKQITISQSPFTFVSGIKLDVLSGSPTFYTKSTYDFSGYLSANVIQLPVGSDLSEIAVGDYISVSGTSPVPQLPVEMIDVLTTAVMVKCLEVMGDKESYAIKKNELIEVKKRISLLLSPRAENAVKKICVRSTIFRS